MFNESSRHASTHVASVGARSVELLLFTVEDDIKVVPIFIDIAKHNPSFTDCQRELMEEPEERIITHVSNLRTVKRVADVIEVFDRIQKEIPAKLLMVGEGPEKEACEELCIEKGIKNKVVFLGNSSEVGKILCFSDLFLLPSEKESFGLAALEAMASGVPVISSNAGGLPEVNKNGVSGYLSDVGNVDEMAKNAVSILSSEETLAKFKKQARETAKTFDTKNIVPLYEAVYEQAVKMIV